MIKFAWTADRHVKSSHTRINVTAPEIRVVKNIPSVGREHIYAIEKQRETLREREREREREIFRNVSVIHIMFSEWKKCMHGGQWYFIT